MNETSPLQKQDITPIYYSVDEIKELLKEINKNLALIAKYLDRLHSSTIKH